MHLHLCFELVEELNATRKQKDKKIGISKGILVQAKRKMQLQETW